MKKCINRRCNKTFDDDFKFCPYCGKNQEVKKRTTKARRTKGTGSIYCRKDTKSKPWVAMSSITGEQKYIGSFATKIEAETALKDYEYNPVTDFNITLSQLHEQWMKQQSYKSLCDSTKSNYKTSWDKLITLHNMKFRELRTANYQAVIDFYSSAHHKRGVDGQLMYVDKNGKNTYKKTNRPLIIEGLKFSALNKVKCLLTSMYKYAMMNDIVNKDYATYIELPEPNDVKRTRFTDMQLLKVKQSIGVIPYAEYIYALCYLNFRVSEFLELTTDNYIITETGIPIFVAGKKTDAGTNRIVPIHPNIQGIVEKCIANGGKTIFCGSDGEALNKDNYLKYYFRPATRLMDLPDDLTPHSCRRTFSTRMSASGAREEDIIALMGHTNYDVDIKHYINQETETLYKAIKLMA